MDALWSRYVVAWAEVLSEGFPATAFGRSAPVVVEVGFGNGNALVTLAKTRPDWNCLGVDVYQPGFGALMLRCEREEVANVRIVNAEATTLLRHLAPGAVREINAFFPDPWPKKRHHKRRLVNAQFAAAVKACLAPDGTLALATDDAGYAVAMAEVLAAAGFRGGPAARPSRPVTPFEAKAHAAGRAVTELAFRHPLAGEA